MGKLRDLTGQRFTRLLVLSRASDTRQGKPQWLCQCDCGNQKIVASRQLVSGGTKSCSCYNRDQARAAKTKAPIALRFWDYVAVSGPDKCWEWQAAINDSGYGIINVGGTNRRAHRVAWSLRHGREPEQWILHHCDNRSCCNPAHLYEGDVEDNSRDKIKARRHRNAHTGPMTPEEEFATRGYRLCTN